MGRRHSNQPLQIEIAFNSMTHLGAKFGISYRKFAPLHTDFEISPHPSSLKNRL